MYVPTGRNVSQSTSRDVTASELAAFAYCAKAWHLERMLGATPAPNSARARDAGTIAHAQHGRATRIGSSLGRHASHLITFLVMLAILLVALAFFLA